MQQIYKLPSAEKGCYVDTKKHDWTKEQPHHSTTGKITTEDFAKKHPDKVEWVKGKK